MLRDSVVVVVVVVAVVRNAPTSNTASHDNHEKINSWVSFSFLYEHGAPLGGSWSRRSSAIIRRIKDQDIDDMLWSWPFDAMAIEANIVGFVIGE